MQDSCEIKIEVITLPYVHNGGAWKVAYADFVTAMMAFFLLMWLLNATTKDEREALSDYFNPSHPMVSSDSSGAGGVMGGLTMSPEGSMASIKNPLIPIETSNDRKRGTEVKSTVAKKRNDAEQKRFNKTAEKLKAAIRKDDELRKLANNIMIDITDEGMRIQIVDQDGSSMFPPGGARMFEKTRLLLQQITDIVLDMPNDISVRGNTDASHYAEGAKYTNWELSSDRANASRRVMIESGLPEERISNVIGNAATQPLIVDNPLDARNRRITLILLNEDEAEHPTSEDEEEVSEEYLELENEDDYYEEFDIQDIPDLPEDPFEKTPGAVEFP